jgi:hypothetical protein
LPYEIERERTKQSEQRPQPVDADAEKTLVLIALAIQIRIRELNKVDANADGTSRVGRRVEYGDLPRRIHPACTLPRPYLSRVS